MLENSQIKAEIQKNNRIFTLGTLHIGAPSSERTTQQTEQQQIKQQNNNNIPL